MSFKVSTNDFIKQQYLIHFYTKWAEMNYIFYSEVDYGLNSFG